MVPVFLSGGAAEHIVTVDVPIGGTLAATKKLEAKLGIDLTSHPTEEEVVAKLWRWLDSSSMHRRVLTLKAIA